MSNDLSAGNHSSRIGFGAAMQFAAVIFQQVVKYGTNLLIARFMGAGVLGLFSISLTVWTAVEMTLGNGLMRGVMRFVPQYVTRGETGRARGVVRLSLLTAGIAGTLIAVIIHLTAENIAGGILRRPELAPVLRIMALSMPLAGLSSVIWATARSLGNIHFILYQFVFVPVVFVCAVIPAALSDGEATDIAWAWNLSYLLPLLPLLLYLRRLLAPFGQVAAMPEVRRLFAFFAVAGLMWLADFASRNVDIAILTMKRPVEEVGIYTMASRTATLAIMVMVSFNAFFSPTAAALHSAGQHGELNRLLRRASLWILMVGAPVLAAAAALSQPIMGLFGEDFRIGAPALIILCVGQVFNISTGLIASVLTMSDRQYSVLAANIAGLTANIVLCFLLIPAYGLYGAAIAMSSSIIIVNTTLCIWGHVTMGLNPFSKATYKPLCAAGAGGIAAWLALPLLAPSGLVQLAVGIAVVAAVFVLVLWLLRGLGDLLHALELIRQGINKKARRTPAPPGTGDGNAGGQ